MIIDTGNILRQDLSDFYVECERRTALKARALELDPDVFVINKNDYKQMHSFGMLAASMIADECSMVKLATQTGVDALTINLDTTTGKDIKEYPAVDANGAYEETMGKNHEAGEKMVPGLTDIVLFSIDGLDDTQKRYTVVQEFIKNAIIHFIMYKWYHTLAKMDIAQGEYVEYISALENVRFNSVRNHKAKDASTHRKPRYY